MKKRHTKIIFKKVTDKMIDAAYANLEQKVQDRAIRKLHQKIIKSGQSLQGLDNIFNHHDANFLAFESWKEELAGIPMPPPVPSTMGLNFISRAVKKVKKAVTNIAKVVRKAVKKVGPMVLGAVVSFYAGPIAGKAVAAAMGKVASNMAAKKIQENEYQKMVKAAKAKAAAAGPAAGPAGFSDLPLGVTNDQAQMIVDGKIPPGMNEEKVWHIIEQAKLIGEQGIMPVDAYVLHYHTYAKDAPPIDYVTDPDPALVERLEKLQEQLKPKNLLQAGGQASTIDELKLKFKLARLNNPDIASSPYGRKQLEDINKQIKYLESIKPIQEQIKALEVEIEKSTKKTFPGAKYEGAGSAPIVPVPPAVQQETKVEAVETVLSPEVTAKVEAAAKEVLKQDGIDIQSATGQEALKLQIQQLQQQVAEAISKGQSIVTVPYTAPNEPAVKVVQTPEGEAVAIKKESNAGALLLPAIGLLIALKGGA